MNILLWAVSGLVLMFVDEPTTSQVESRSDLVKSKMKLVQGLIGEWKGTASPLDRESKRQRLFWKETNTWSWSLAKDKVGFTWKSDGSKRFKSGFLTYLPDKQVYQLTLERVDKPTLTLVGKFADNKLELEGSAEQITYKLVFTIPNESRFLYAVSQTAQGQPATVKTLEVGNTRAGVAFATKSAGPVCIVTGGLGTMEVRYKGKTYYVCCTGCKEEFEADPEKYVNKKAKP